MNVGIYLRISSDPNNDQQATRRQLEDCRDYADRHGMNVVDVYEDVDISGFKRVQRPAFERLLRDLETGKVEGFLAYRVERILRNWRDWVRLEEIREKNGAFALTLDGNDTRTAPGRGQFELFVYMAKMESERISERTKRAHLDNAKRGQPKSGGLRPWGYSRDMSVIEPEAEVIRECYRRLRAGASLTSLVRWFKEENITSPSGSFVNTQNLSRSLRTAHLAGLRVHHGVEYPGTWEAIVSVEELTEMRTLLLNRIPAPRGPWHHSLLSRIARCASCGNLLSGRWSRQKTGERYYTYRCVHTDLQQYGLGLTVAAPRMDPIVVEMFLAALKDYLPRLRVSRETTETTDYAAAIRNDEEGIARLNDAYFVDRTIGSAEHARLSAVIHARLQANRDALAATLAEQSISTVSPALIAEAWHTMDLDWQRRMLRTFADIRITGPGRGRRLYPDLVSLELRNLGE